MNDSKNNTGFIAVLKREINRMISRRIYFGATIILPLFCIFFMSTIFNNGQMENIPIGVVDLDQTAASRSVIRNVSATPIVEITHRYSNQANARTATQAKEIYGYLVIPHNFEQNVMDGKQTSLEYYYHYALLSVGGEVLGAFETVLQPLSAVQIMSKATAMGIDPSQTTTFIAPMLENSNPLFNPGMDYSIYLSNPFFFVFLQILILLTTVYSVGIEKKKQTAENWLKTAGGNIYIAVFGKLLPYTVIYSVMAIFGNYVMFGLLNIPFSCGFFPLNLSSILLVIASQALGLFIYSLFPVMGIIISIVSMVGSLGATLCGVTFPTPEMFPIVHYASYLFPIRHFVLINQNLLYGDYGFAYTWQNYVYLIVFIVPMLLVLPLLRHSIVNHTFESFVSKGQPDENEE